MVIALDRQESFQSVREQETLKHAGLEIFLGNDASLKGTYLNPTVIKITRMRLTEATGFGVGQVTENKSGTRTGGYNYMRHT